MSRSLNWPAVWRAAVTCCTFALPLGLLQQYLNDSNRIDRGDPTNLLLYFAILFCGALGGYAAAGLAPARPLQHGAAAAALATIVIQLGGVVRRVVVGREMSNPLGWIFLALLMATCGMFGAYIHRGTHASAAETGRLDGPAERPGAHRT